MWIGRVTSILPRINDKSWSLRQLLATSQSIADDFRKGGVVFQFLSSLTWKSHVHSIAKHVNLASFLEPVAFAPLLSYWLKYQTRPSVETAPMSLEVLLNPLSVSSTSSFQNHPYQQQSKCHQNSPVSFLSSFGAYTSIPYRYFHGHYSRKSGILFLIYWDLFKPAEALRTQTLFQFYYLIHEPYPTNLHSFIEYVNYGTSYVPLPSQSPITCLFSLI